MSIDASLTETIDRIVAGHGFIDPPASSFTERLQAAAAPHAPLCIRIADSLRHLAGETVFLFTGFVVPERMPAGENDGPLGTVVLARALCRLGLRPEIWVDPQVLDTIIWLAAEIGADLDIHAIERSCLVRRTPAAAVAIEKPGRNRVGVMHTFDGAAIHGGSVSIDELFTQWATRSVLTIGIGDRGNEIGFGSISDAVRAARPDAATCQCGCGGGVVAATATDLLLPSAVSNWGAYGIAASLGLLSRDPGCLVTPAEESRLLQTAAVRGCRDGVRRRGTFSVDAVSGSVSVAVVRALEDLVVDTLSRPKNEDACA